MDINPDDIVTFPATCRICHKPFLGYTTTGWKAPAELREVGLWCSDCLYGGLRGFLLAPLMVGWRLWRRLSKRQTKGRASVLTMDIGGNEAMNLKQALAKLSKGAEQISDRDWAVLAVSGYRSLPPEVRAALSPTPAELAADTSEPEPTPEGGPLARAIAQYVDEIAGRS
jgi:hypothetical protein